MREAIETWDDNKGAWAGVSDDLPIENDGAKGRTAEDDEDGDWMTPMTIAGTSS